MFTRSRKKFTALIALCAVLFAALMPATVTYASTVRTLSVDQVVALGGICVSHEAGAPAPAVPAAPAAAHEHCAFCSVSAPVVFLPRVDALLSVLDAPALVQPALHNDALPRDAVAFYPLSPRAPPRAL